MGEAIVVAVITGAFSLVGVLIASSKSAREIDHKLETHQAVTDTKLEELTREVRIHNGFAEKIPVMQEQITELKGSVNTLKNYHMQ